MVELTLTQQTTEIVSRPFLFGQRHELWTFCQDSSGVGYFSVTLAALGTIRVRHNFSNWPLPVRRRLRSGVAHLRTRGPSGGTLGWCCSCCTSGNDVTTSGSVSVRTAQRETSRSATSSIVQTHENKCIFVSVIVCCWWSVGFGILRVCCWRSSRNPRRVNPLAPNDPYRGRTAPLNSKRCILYIYSTNIGTEYFKHGIYSPFFFCLQNVVYFIILTYLVPVLFIFYIQSVLKLKKIRSNDPYRSRTAPLTSKR